MTPTAIQTRLQELGKLADDAAPLCETLILLGALDRENVELAPYYDHITTLHQALEHEIEQHLPAQENAHWQLERLNTVLLQQFGYHKDQSSFDDPNQINFLNVIDQRAGLPVAISALYLELAQRRGWQAAGLQFPGHFLIRLEQDGERVIADPFHGGQEMNAGSLRHLLKTTVGPQAELSHTYYDTVSNREVILRFCNNRKNPLYRTNQLRSSHAGRHPRIMAGP